MRPRKSLPDEAVCLSLDQLSIDLLGRLKAHWGTSLAATVRRLLHGFDEGRPSATELRQFHLDTWTSIEGMGTGTKPVRFNLTGPERGILKQLAVSSLGQVPLSEGMRCLVVYRAIKEEVVVLKEVLVKRMVIISQESKPKSRSLGRISR